jgi:hypothetical protein
MGSQARTLQPGWHGHRVQWPLRPDAQKLGPFRGPSVASRREAKGYRAGCSATGPPSLSGRYSSRRHATRATTAQRSATAATFLVTVIPIIAIERLVLPPLADAPNTRSMPSAILSVRRCTEATVRCRPAQRGLRQEASRATRSAGPVEAPSKPQPRKPVFATFN